MEDLELESDEEERPRFFPFLFVFFFFFLLSLGLLPFLRSLDLSRSTASNKVVVTWSSRSSWLSISQIRYWSMSSVERCWVLEWIGFRCTFRMIVRSIVGPMHGVDRCLKLDLYNDNSAQQVHKYWLENARNYNSELEQRNPIIGAVWMGSDLLLGHFFIPTFGFANLPCTFSVAVFHHQLGICKPLASANAPVTLFIPQLLQQG